MSDIVKRLHWTYPANYPVMDDAANEIKKLRALLKEAADDLEERIDGEQDIKRYMHDMDVLNRINTAIRGEDS